MKQILVAEDDREINRLLCHYLTTLGYQTHSAENGLEALSVLKAQPDTALVLLDLMLPFQSGEVVLQKIRECSVVPVMILSARDSVQTKIDLLRAGADDYLTKPFDLDELAVRIEAVLRRCDKAMKDGTPDAVQLFCRGLCLDRTAKTVSVNGQPLTLTGKEFAILELLLQNPTKLFSKANLFESIWGEPYFCDDNTVKVHMSNLRSKLKASAPAEEYIETVWGMGYKLKA